MDDISVSERTIDVMQDREKVLEIVVNGEHIAREVYELRLALFYRAAESYSTKPGVLEPFPSCFFDPVRKTRRYDELNEIISKIPEMKDFNDRTSLPELAWKLLHWIFTNPLKIKVVEKDELSEYFTDELREETKLFTIPYPSIGCNRFKITHPIDINSTKVFLTHKQKYQSFFAYHGSPGLNFHSIIHRGLRCSLNRRAMYGPGTYLTSDLNTALSYSRGSGRFWSGNPGRVTGCVAIVEVIKHPSIRVVDFSSTAKPSYDPDAPMEPPNFDDTSSNGLRYYIVNSDELMRLKHLLVYY